MGDGRRDAFHEPGLDIATDATAARQNDAALQRMTKLPGCGRDGEDSALLTVP
jgi:hypothetical protein